MKTDKPVNLVVRFSFFSSFSVFLEKKDAKRTIKRKAETGTRRIFSVLRSSFWQKRKNVHRKQFPFHFSAFSFSTEVELLFFLFCLPVSDKRRTRKRKLEYVFRSRFPLRFRVKENEKENRQAKTFSSYDFRFSVFVLLFSAMRTETEHRKGIHYPFCVCRFGKSGKAKNVVLLRFFFWFSRKRKNAGFLFNLTFFVFGENEKCFCWHYTVLGSLVTIQCFPMPILRH